MSIPLDRHGQPQNMAFNARRRCERDISELLGLAKGVLADGLVNDEEARYITNWILAHPDGAHQFPLSLILSRVKHIFADGRVDDDEREDLKQLLSELVGGVDSVLLGYDAATLLPLCDPPPLVSWFQEVFVLTGKFAYGTRRQCQHEIFARGGDCEEDVSQRTTFMVIGTFGSEDWRHTAYGRKIEKAVQLRSKGFPIRIIGEDHWAAALEASHGL